MADVYASRRWNGKLVFECKVTALTLEAVPLTASHLLRLSASEARDLAVKLQLALTTPVVCLDCGSDLHTVDDPGCPMQHDTGD